MTTNGQNNHQITSDLDLVQVALPNILQETLSLPTSPTLTVVKESIYPYSQIRIVELKNNSGINRRFYLKRINFPNKDRSLIENNIVQEENILLSLNKEMPKESVQLIAAFPSYCTIVTEECVGKSLDSIINSYRFWWLPQFNNETSENLPYLCGNWLQRFHAITLESSCNLRPWYNFISGEMNWRTRQLSKMLPDYGNLFETCDESFEQDLNILEENGPSHVYHADFAPHNIFIRNKKIQTIDFSGIMRGHGILDVINFLSSIASRSENPLFPKGKNRQFCKAFLDGYGPINLPDPRISNLLFVLQSVKRLVVLTNFQTSSNSANALIYRKHMEQYLNHLKAYVKSANMLATDSAPWLYHYLAKYLV